MRSNVYRIIKKTVSVTAIGLIGATAGCCAMYLKKEKEVVKTRSLSQKHLDMMIFLNDWVRYKQQGKTMVSFFERNNYKTIH